MSALSTRLTLGPYAPTASQARRTTSMHSAQEPSTVVNIESVWLGRPLSRTIRTAAATASLTEPVDSEADGATEKAISMNRS